MQESIGAAIRRRYLKRYLPDVKSTKFNSLDAGAGDGKYRGLVESKGYKYYGIDKEPKADFIKKADIIKKIPFENNFFDTCICIDVIEEIVKVKQAIREIHRVLKTPSLLILHTPNSEQTHILADFLDNPNHVRKGFIKAELYNLLSEFASVEIFPTFNILECIAWELINLQGEKTNLDRMFVFHPDNYKNLGWVVRCLK